MRLGLLRIVVDCPACPEFSVGLVPTTATDASRQPVEGLCDCGALLVATVALTGVKCSKTARRAAQAKETP